MTSSIRRALRLVWESGSAWMVASIALLLIQGALPLLSLYLVKLVVDAVAGTASGGGVQPGQVGVLVGLAGAVALASALCRSLAGVVGEGQAHAVTDHMHDILHAKSVEVDLGYYENPQYHDTLHRAQQEASFRPTRVLNELAQVTQGGLSVLFMASLLFWFEWSIAAVLVLAAIPAMLVRAKYAGQLYTWQRRQTPTERRAWYFHWMLTGPLHAKEIRLFGLGDEFRRRFRGLRAQLRRERLGHAMRRLRAEALAQTVTTAAVFGAYGYIAYRALQGTITLGDLVMYYQAFQRGQESLREMLGGLAGLYEDHLFLSSVYDLLDMKRTVVQPVNPRPVSRMCREGIAFHHVSFQYPDADRRVLRDVTLTIRPREHVAFVGENGSGKTTLIKLLCRLYDPTEGHITIDGIDLREFDTAALHREMSVIFQDYGHYHLTARENIWFGNVRLSLQDEHIERAARRSGADDVIMRLRHGYDSILGKWFEDGEELSIGEWQRVALARGFLRDAQMIVLDEPTSALDARAEYEVFKRFRQLVEGRTSIIISHRFSTVRMADRIYVFEDGRVVEEGRHDELVERGGKYAHLFEAQAQYYR